MEGSVRVDVSELAQSVRGVVRLAEAAGDVCHGLFGVQGIEASET
ncbi:hypothetical protein [Microtetraspora fusca]|nr:hypothetical protein [Microtetraspora fusca]